MPQEQSRRLSDGNAILMEIVAEKPQFFGSQPTQKRNRQNRLDQTMQKHVLRGLVEGIGLFLFTDSDLLIPIPSQVHIFSWLEPEIADLVSIFPSQLPTVSWAVDDRRTDLTRARGGLFFFGDF